MRVDECTAAQTGLLQQPVHFLQVICSYSEDLQDCAVLPEEESGIVLN